MLICLEPKYSLIFRFIVPTDFCIGKVGIQTHPNSAICDHFVLCGIGCISNLPCSQDVLKCASDLFYNPALKTCDFKENVQCALSEGEVCYGAKNGEQ